MSITDRITQRFVYILLDEIKTIENLWIFFTGWTNHRIQAFTTSWIHWHTNRLTKSNELKEKNLENLYAKPINMLTNSFTSAQYSNGNHFSSAMRVRSGSLVSVCTHFKRLAMR